MHQRRLAAARLLGEMYKAKVINTATVFAQLYLLISFGHSNAFQDSNGSHGDGGGQQQHPMDPADDTIRVRLVCQLLETCGKAFGASGPPKKTLDRFFAFFQRYALAKNLTLEVAHDVRETLTAFRPKLEPHADYQSASAECARWEEEEARKAKAAGGAGGGAAAGAGAEGVGLEGIAEEEDDDDDESDGDDDESSDSESEADEDEEEEEAEVDDEEEDEEEEEEEDADGGGESPPGESPPVDVEPEERVRRERPRISREDELDFDREMSRFLGAGVKAASTADMPPNLSNGAGPRLVSGTVSGTSAGNHKPAAGGTVAFRMLTKRGAPKELAVPADAEFVAAAAEKRAAEEKERAEMKRLVLAAAEAEDSGAGSVIPKFNNMRVAVKSGGGAAAAAAGAADVAGGAPMASPSGCSSCWVNPPLSERRVTSERRCVMERTALYNTARVGEFCAGPRKNLILSSSDLPVRVRLRGLLLHQAEHDVVEPVGPPVLGAVRRRRGQHQPPHGGGGQHRQDSGDSDHAPRHLHVGPGVPAAHRPCLHPPVGIAPLAVSFRHVLVIFVLPAPGGVSAGRRQRDPYPSMRMRTTLGNRDDVACRFHPDPRAAAETRRVRRRRANPRRGAHIPKYPSLYRALTPCLVLWRLAKSRGEFVSWIEKISLSDYFAGVLTHSP